MEDNFRVRVEKAFGSLSSSSSISSSLWCLSDEEIEKREWNRHKEESPDPDLKPAYPPNLDGFFANKTTTLTTCQPDFNKQDLQFDLHDRDGSLGPDCEEGDIIQSAIGLDCTLDCEEEEDEYDKVAVGGEKDGDQLFRSKNYDYGVDINSYNELPNTFRDVSRDPRANHMAAKMRLKEDAEAADKIDSLQVSNAEAPPPAINTLEDGVDLKPILKKRESCGGSKSQKRVRFDPRCKNDCEEEESEGTKDLPMETSSMEEEARVSDASSSLPQDSSGVPDYVRNPSKYTHYTFDSSSDNTDDESNRKAYMDFINMLKKPSTIESHLDYTNIDLPKSVAFIPKTKRGSSFKHNEEDVSKGKALPIGIAAEDDAHESEVVSAMDVDEPENAAERNSIFRGSGRQYRKKTNVV